MREGKLTLILENLKQLSAANTKVISNYLHMTFLQVLNSFFYLLVYPFVINKVGVESFGLYVFFTSITSYLMVIVNFGFDTHAAKIISLGQESINTQAKLFSNIAFSKIFLSAIAVLIFVSLFLIFPIFQDNFFLAFWCFFNVASCVFMPAWYYHGMQKMKIITIIQLSIKIISLPFIFICINNSEDTYLYAFIVSMTNVVSGVVASYIAIRHFHVYLMKIRFVEMKSLMKEVQPFFWSTAANTFKQKSVEIFIGIFFGMKEVAVYDLANKIFSIPSLLASNINAALFPKIVQSPREGVVRKIIISEAFIGIFAIIFVAAFGRAAVNLIGVSNMDDSYYISILLSFNIIAYLMVGSCIYFIFVPKERYDLVLKNQIVSFVSFYLFCIIYMSINWSVYSIVLALVSSGLLEMTYCYFLLRSTAIR